MASKQKKPGKGNPAPTHNQKVKGANPHENWIAAALYGLLGAGAFYFLHPILNFTPTFSSGVISGLTFLSGVLAFLGATNIFRQHIHTVSLWTLPLVLLQVVVNIMLTYGWVGQEAVWMFFANRLTIPLGIIWFFILRSTTDGGSPKVAGIIFSIKEVFSLPLTKIGGLVILIISAGMIFYRLGYYDIWEDENLVINAAIGFSESGFSYFKEGYDRAWMHTVLCAGVFEIFGVSEYTGRLPSAIFGIVFVLACFYFFAKWYGLAWLALLIPLICLMNDRFLILFRYMRMYAILIPFFLAGVFVIYKAVMLFQETGSNKQKESGLIREQVVYGIAGILFLFLLAHIHKLSMVLLPAFGLFIVYLALVFRSRNQMRLLFIFLSGGVLLLFLAFIIQLDALRMFKQVADRVFTAHDPMPEYFQYVLENGLPRNSTFMLLLAGIGLFQSGVGQRLKSLLFFNYSLIIIALLSMVFLIEAEGRDYRYTAHIVPFVVCNLLFVAYYIGRVFGQKTYPWIFVGVLLLSSLQFIKDYKQVYIKHPWAPSYAAVYGTLLSEYRPGDALFAQNIKTYYLDPVALAGEHYHKISKKNDYTKQQFLADIRVEGHGWIMWELHKSHHWRRDILEYIYSNFKPVHSHNLDDLGVALFYFNETMITQD